MANKFYTSVIPYKNHLLVREVVDGHHIQKKVKYKPYLFVPAPSTSNTKYKTIFGKPVDRIDFPLMNGARNFLRTYGEVDNFQIFGFNRFEYTYINDTYNSELHVNPEDLNIGTIDIEVAKDENGYANIEAADKEITAITIKRKDLITSFACVNFDPPDGVIYIKCANEETLLRKFLKTWEYLNLDIVTGWGVETFDIPYILRRLTRVLGSEHAARLSPWHIISQTKIKFNGQLKEVPTPLGISVLDYMALYKKFTYSQQESYTLNYICHVEIDEQKVDYSEYQDLQELYEENPQKFMEYNIHDVVLVDKLEDKMGLIALAIIFSYDAKINFNDVFGTVRPWDVIIHNYLMARNVVIPQYKESIKTDQFRGAYVKETQIGSHDWIVTGDFESLYPRLMVQYNMSPETLSKKYNVNVLDKLLANEELFYDECSIAGNGQTFTNEFKGFIPDIIEKYLLDRKEYKKKYLKHKQEFEQTKELAARSLMARYNNLQMARKIQVNALYGSIGNPYSRWYKIDFAEAVTVSGQMCIQYVEKKIYTYLNELSGIEKDRIVAGDTDSLMMCLDDFATDVDALDKFFNIKLQPFLDKLFEDIASKTCAYTNFMLMKREAIASRGIFVAKKNYILNVIDNEGVRYKEPEMKVMGISAVRSSTPSSCRKAIKDGLKVILNEDNDSLIEFIDNFRDTFSTLPFTEIAFPRGCNGLTKYFDPDTLYKSKTPIHVRGALLYNKLLKDMKLDKKFPKIYPGDKVKFIYLKLPNHIKENVIAVPVTLYPELGLDKYIDYEEQFQRAFLSSIRIITDAIGWKIKHIHTLEDFFID